MPRKELAALLLAARRRAGFESRYSFCKATGLSLGSIGAIERGEKSPSIETLEKIMGAIDWEVEIVFRPRARRAR